MNFYQRKFHSGYLNGLIRESMGEINDPQSVTNAHQVSTDLIEKLTKEIESNNLIVAKVQKPLHLITKKELQDPARLAQYSARKLQQIKDKKAAMEKELLYIQIQEERMKKSGANGRNSNSQNYLKSYKSEMSLQDAEKLRLLKLAHHQFQKSLQDKTKAYQQKLKKFKQQQRELHEKQLNEKCQQRKREIQKNLEQLTRRQDERERRLKREKQMMQQIQKKKKVYQEMQKKWKSAEQEQQKKRQELLQQRKKLQGLDYDNLKQHKKKYYELMSKQRLEREKRILEMQKEFGSSGNASESRLFQSRLLNIVMEEEHKRKYQEQEKRKLPKINTEKKIQYALNVRQRHKPKVKPVDQKVQNPQQKKAQNLRSLSSMEILEKGNTYMKEAHKNVSLVKVADTIFSEQSTPFKYRDYLKEMGRTTKSGQSPPEILEIRKVLKSQDVSQYEKFQRAKSIAQRMDGKNSTTNDLVNNINAKLEILKEVRQ